MREYLIKIVFAVTMMLGTVTPASADTDQFYQGLVIDRCDGVVMHKQFLPNDESTGITTILIPGIERMLYGAFEHGDVIEFGYLDQEPTFNEDSHFDWGEWVDTELQEQQLDPWYANDESCAGLV